MKILNSFNNRAHWHTGWTGPPNLHGVERWLALPEFFGGFVHNALWALQSDHLSPKSDNFLPKRALISQNRSSNHIYLTFSLSKMILALLSKNVQSHIYPILAMPGFWEHLEP